MSAPRTLVIGLDGATFDLITPWVRAGHLPTLGRLIDQGVHGPLLAWPNMNSAAAWTSMVTGCNPGQHSIYDFGTAAPQRGVVWQPATAAARAKPPFWLLLSAANQNVGIVNLPISYPADPVNGFMLAGMDAPNINSRGFAHPPGLLDELRRTGIHYILDAPKLAGPRERDPRRVPDLVRRMVDTRARAILHLMKTHPWDLLMAVFVATDRMQHFYWPRETPSIESADWAPVRSIYQQIDAFLGEALSLVGDEANVVLVSDHGFGPSLYATRAVNRLLERLGMIGKHQQGGSLSGRLLKNALQYGRRLIPLSLQPHLARALPKLHLRSLGESTYAGIDWAHTHAFAHPYGGDVYVNLRGRQPEGIVAPGEYDEVRERVYDVLMSLTDASTGKRVVRKIGRREELYHGPYTQDAADLLIHWDYDVVGDSLRYDGEGEPVVIRESDAHSRGNQWRGGHRPEGIFIAHGPNLKRGATVAGATLYDIAPTLLHMQGHPIPGDLDGKVLTEIFTPERLDSHPVQHCESTGAQGGATPADLDEAETREVEKRLRDLGYIE